MAEPGNKANSVPSVNPSVKRSVKYENKSLSGLNVGDTVAVTATSIVKKTDNELTLGEITHSLAVNTKDNETVEIESGNDKVNNLTILPSDQQITPSSANLGSSVNYADIDKTDNQSISADTPKAKWDMGLRLGQDGTNTGKLVSGLKRIGNVFSRNKGGTRRKRRYQKRGGTKHRR